MGANAQPYIVAEVSCNWIGSELWDPDAGLLSDRFERVLNANAARGYELQSFQMTSTLVGVNELNETVIAVFRQAAHVSPNRTPRTVGAHT